MPRRRMDGSTAQNQSIYHYQVVELDENNDEINVLYFLTCKDVEDRYGVSQKLVYRFTSNPEYTSKKVPHIKIFKCNRPVFRREPIEYPINEIA